MWWFLTGLISVVLAVVFVVVTVKKGEFFTDGEPEEITVGDISKGVLFFVGGIIFGKITAIILTILMISYLVQSDKVVWSGKKDETV